MAHGSIIIDHKHESLRENDFYEKMKELFEEVQVYNLEQVDAQFSNFLLFLESRIQ